MPLAHRPCESGKIPAFYIGFGHEQEVIPIRLPFHERDQCRHQLDLTERQQMPAEASRQRSRQRIEQADEAGVVQRALEPAVQARFYRKAFGHDADRRKLFQQIPNSPIEYFFSIGARRVRGPPLVTFDNAFSHDTRLYT